jgi:hypothetical protein
MGFPIAPFLCPAIAAMDQITAPVKHVAALHALRANAPFQGRSPLLMLRAAAAARRDLALARFGDSQIRWAVEAGLGPLLNRCVADDPEARNAPLWPLIQGGRCDDPLDHSRAARRDDHRRLPRSSCDRDPPQTHRDLSGTLPGVASERIPTHPNRRRAELLPRAWKATRADAPQ